MKFSRHPHTPSSVRVASVMEGLMTSQRAIGSLALVDSISWDIENRRQKLIDTYLQKATRIIFLNHLQAVLHETRGLAQFHCAVRDLISNHLGLMTDRRAQKWQRGEKKQTGTLESSANQNPRASWNKPKFMRLFCSTDCCGQWHRGQVG